ncbi:pyridoxal 5'-phosphate synthase glutaminase subunit PdxT [Mobilitalea sibirica]|uniref:Pyridoxal 5'-phosphate synthase subunit PdxT n=1 Tax=Mobilitalea sibirica TaxID=1462919 RepID=A0A8J7HD89_9FIRM|nr:pyridoxal 5'-phosphate synthase glutaminase subunit PdxT [Mobilitalea sibirica]MBH1941782.1 pyridoxal 5'-phosphate synthase glutaminase subunit PdxT [Mobilitalea sibirica]
MQKRIGVLAVQGAFAEHINILNKLGVEAFEIRQKSDLYHGTMEGIILPGGESTVMGKLLRELEMFEDLKTAIEDGLPVLGTCAGLILLAKSISNDKSRYFGTMDIKVKRNAYGRQLGSFHTISEFKGIGDIPMTFIRAPYIEEVAKDQDVKILAEIDGHIVAARQRNMLVTSFHPELTSDYRVHQYFLEKVSSLSLL